MSFRAYLITEFEIEETPIFDLDKDYFFLEILGRYCDAQDQIDNYQPGYFDLYIGHFNELQNDFKNVKTNFPELDSEKINRIEEIMGKISQKFQDESVTIPFYSELGNVYFVKKLKTGHDPVFNVLEPFILNLCSQYCDIIRHRLPEECGIFGIDYECLMDFKNAWEHKEPIRTNNPSIESDIEYQLKIINNHIEKGETVIRNDKLMFFIE